MSRVVSYLHNSNNLEESEEKCFVCIIDGKVISNIIKLKLKKDDVIVPVILPDWQTFLQILQSKNSQFIERPIPILPGTIWDGENFIADVKEGIQGNETQVNTNDTGVYIKINNSYIYHENNLWNLIQNYLFYEIELVRNFLEQNPSLEINIVFAFTDKKDISFSNNNRIIYIYLNVEQLIFKYDDIEVLPKEPEAKLTFNNIEYTANTYMIDSVKDTDIIFEYSKPNIKILEISGLYPEIVSKFQYVSACFYKNVVKNDFTRNIDTLTLFSSTKPGPKREQKLQEINSLLINHRNETDYFGDELTTLLQNTKILINIHHSDSQATLEELRILPALMQKVLVVSEISPLTELIPFNPLIIWTTYDNIVQKTKEVLDNYETYYNQIFTEQNINLLNNLHIQNCINVSNKLNSLLSN